MPKEIILDTHPESFIGGWVLDDITICDELITHFQNSSKKSIGHVTTLAGKEINKDMKDCTEVTLFLEEKEDILFKYLIKLQDITDQYIQKYFFSNRQGAWSVVENVNLQHYAPGQGYKVWHCERSSYKLPIAGRHLVFMTYLNDVADQGETEFFYQKIKVKPQKGLTLIWPADWTHTHKGIVSPSEEKYIITGWYGYVE